MSVDLFGAPVPEPEKPARGFTHEPRVSEAETVDWFTPPWIFERLGLRFDLDPCAPAGGLPWIPAERFYSLPDDGLDLPWSGRVWCNPPYGKDTGKWLARLAAHGDGVALVFARTDAEWFQLVAPKASALLFIAGRVPFVDRTGEPPVRADGSRTRPGTGSVMLAFGDECRAALSRMTRHGWFVDAYSGKVQSAL